MTKYKLKNNLQVILTSQKETKAVTVLVLVGVGSRYESKNIAGISHFLEHMMFKGTKKRPDTLAISKELDRVGAEFNASTSKDNTNYYIKINAEHLELALDMLSDMILNSKFEEQEIEREKGTIIEEINMYEDNPLIGLGFLLEEVVFKGNTLSKDEGGTKKSVRGTTRNKMVNFKNKHYFSENMVISVAGNFKQDKIKKLISKYFSNNNKSIENIKFDKFKSKQVKPQINLKYKKTEQVHLAFGFLGPSYTDKNFIATNILSVILGGSMSSRLFINIRERHGLCYHIGSGLSTYQDIGNLNIRAGLDKDRIMQAIELILNELRKIKSKGITKEELNKAKEYIKGKMILHLEDSSSVADWYARQQLLVGTTKTPEQKIAEIMKVTKADVNKVAKKMFQTKNINLALIGPFKSEKEFLKVLKI